MIARVRRSPKRMQKAAPVPNNAIEAMLEPHLEALAVKQYSQQTIKTRRDQLGVFIRWCVDRSLENPHDITRPVLEGYQSYLFNYRKRNRQAVELPYTVRNARSFARLVPLDDAGELHPAQSSVGS